MLLSMETVLLFVKENEIQELGKHRAEPVAHPHSAGVGRVVGLWLLISTEPTYNIQIFKHSDVTPAVL